MRACARAQIETEFNAGKAGRMALHRVIDGSPALCNAISHESRGWGADRRLTLRKCGFPTDADSAMREALLTAVRATREAIDGAPGA